MSDIKGFINLETLEIIIEPTADYFDDEEMEDSTARVRILTNPAKGQLLMSLSYF